MVYRDKRTVSDRLRKKLAEKNKASKGSAKTICLNMIVRNESQNMPRLLNSLVGIIDMACITDTGSTDDTIEVIHNWFKNNKNEKGESIPYTICEDEFVNFAVSRTKSLKNSKEKYPDADYYLLSDADFVWVVNWDVFDKSMLSAGKYTVVQKSQWMDYFNIRLVNSKIDWESIGVTHELWTEDSTKDFMGYAYDVIEGLYIEDKEDGGYKAEKFTRDRKLLLGGLADPKTTKNLITRYKFYMGQTLKDLGEYEESIKYYELRILDAKWQEEVYYSMYMIGFNYQMIHQNKLQVLSLVTKSRLLLEEEQAIVDRWHAKDRNVRTLANEIEGAAELALKNYLKAYSYRKTRGEALWRYVSLARMLGRYDEAYTYAEIGRKIVYPRDTLFLERCCYSFLFDLELVQIGALSPKHRELCRKSILILAVRDDLGEYYSYVFSEARKAYAKQTPSRGK